MDEAFNLEALCQGNEKDWYAFYQTYAPYVKRILSWTRWHFSKEEQEEMLQEVFISIVRSVKNYRGEAQISTFISRIAQNTCISAIRKKVAQKRGEGEQAVPFDEILESTLQSYDSTAAGFEERVALQGAVQKLSPECQKLIHKRYAEDLSYETLADHYGESISALAARLKRCLLSLKEIYLGEKKSDKCDHDNGGRK